MSLPFPRLHPTIAIDFVTPLYNDQEIHAWANMTLTNAEKLDWEAYIALNRHALVALGPAQWKLLRYFGKVLDGGPHGGLYVSGLPCNAAKAIVDELIAGSIVQVHLMHRHRSGCYESSALCFREGRLIMLFDNRCEFA